MFKKVLFSFSISLNLWAASPKLTEFSPQEAANIQARNIFHEVSFGTIPGRSLVTRFGFNKDVDSAASETVWSSGGSYAYTASAETLNITSTSTNDDDSGTGAKTVIVYGQDEAGNEISESVTLNGTANVETTLEFQEVSEMEVTLSGSSKTNTGVISAIQSTSSIRLSEIPSAYGISQQAIYQVPAGKKAFVHDVFLMAVKPSGQTPVVEVQVVVYNPTSNTNFIIFENTLDTGVEYSRHIDFPKSRALVAGEVLFVDITTTNNNTQAFVRFSLVETE